jgi:short subunit dehydrogenase-like uncharacterized protein
MNTHSTFEPQAGSAADNRPPVGGKILIIGGYGQVGRAVADRLAPLFPGRVAVAGRSAAKAKTAAAGIGHGAEGREVDIFAADSAAALDGVALVLVCLDQTDTAFVEQCLARGVLYLDISAEYAFLSKVERLDGVARKTGATALLSVGVAPGLTNLLAARAAARMERVDRIDILLEFGLGDHHGQAAVEWMFDNLDAEYEVRENGRKKSVRSFGDSQEFRLPGAKTARATYRFNFPDQHVIGRTLDVPSVSTWIRFDDRLSTWAFAKSSQIGLGRLLRRRWWRRLAVWLFMNVHMGSDVCGVEVRATGRTKDGNETLTLGIVGRKEALMTAIVAAETARQALTGELAPGVFHSEQAVALEPVIAALRRELPDMVVAI